VVDFIDAITSMQMGHGEAMTALPSVQPEWSTRIKRLLKKHGLSQSDLAGRLGVSPATMTRWIQGSHEPTSAAYVAMGNLAGAPEGIYFWERAGIDPQKFPDMNFRISVSSMQVNLKDFNIVTTKKLSSKVITEDATAVVLPLLNLIAYGDRVPPKPHETLAQAEVDDVLMAPLRWCPHPESMISMRVAGDSMAPIIPPDAIIAVDTAVTERGDLDGKIALFSHRDLGFKVARLQRLPASDILVSANHKCLPVDVSDQSKWKAIGAVLWWVSQDPMQPEVALLPRGSKRRAGSGVG
jgi:transcriptional regulator with XRE-family HTH domain